jgi:hypothetical protein
VAGTYYIEVTAAYPYGIDGVPKGVDYQLHVSIAQHPVDAFVFAPAPLAEQEGVNNSGQSVEAGTCWGATTSSPSSIRRSATAAVGVVTNRVDSTTPYVRITGSGDYSYDIYRFKAVSSPQSLTPVERRTRHAIHRAGQSGRLQQPRCRRLLQLGALPADGRRRADRRPVASGPGLPRLQRDDRRHHQRRGGRHAGEGGRCLQVPDRGGRGGGRITGFNNATTLNPVNTNITVDQSNPASPTLFIRNSLVGFQLLGSSATQPAGLDNVVNAPATVTRTTTARLADNSAPIEFSTVCR